ncbi:hypothetical protein VTO42DRAFT_752 [Malbranchea cinnamomea]
MAQQNQPAKVFQDIAIDHRLRPLFKPVSLRSQGVPNGTHVQDIRAIGSRITRGGEEIPAEEIETTVDLARPETEGGIAVVLSQPAKSHLLHEGISRVIEKSPTLQVLDEAFDIASLSTLSFQKDISVMDRSPFIQRGNNVPNALHVKIRNLAAKAIKGKKAHVLLCLGKDDVDFTSDVDVFENGEYLPVPAKLGDGRRQEFVKTYHPSYSANYHPEESCFKELMLLEVVHACGLYRGDWKEDAWMTELRKFCEQTARRLSREQISDPSLHCYRHLGTALSSIERFINDVTKSPTAMPRDESSVYAFLRDSRVSKHCNDANLCLFQMHWIAQSSDASADALTIRDASIERVKIFLGNLINAIQRGFLEQDAGAGFRVATNKRQMSRGYIAKRSMERLQHWANERQRLGHRAFTRVFLRFMAALNSSFTSVGVQSSGRPGFLASMTELANHFLTLAVDIEDLLAELSERNTDVDDLMKGLKSSL